MSVLPSVRFSKVITPVVVGRLHQEKEQNIM
jgi:hypothetical protein